MGRSADIELKVQADLRQFPVVHTFNVLLHETSEDSTESVLKYSEVVEVRVDSDQP